MRNGSLIKRYTSQSFIEGYSKYSFSDRRLKFKKNGGVNSSGSLGKCSTTIETIAMCCRGMGFTGTANLYELIYGDKFPFPIFDTLSIEINAYITDKYATWPRCKLADLVST